MRVLWDLYVPPNQSIPASGLGVNLFALPTLCCSPPCCLAIACFGSRWRLKTRNDKPGSNPHYIMADLLILLILPAKLAIRIDLLPLASGGKYDDILPDPVVLCVFKHLDELIVSAFSRI